MALVYKRSTKKSARQYERSSGMESNRGVRSNPGVNALTVVNSGRAPKANPFQWIGGRKRHRHESPPYRTLRGAKAWREKHPDSGKGRGRARLYPTDEYGTILTQAIPERLLTNPTRRSGMAYNIGALRKAMRANYKGSSGTQEMLRAARGLNTAAPKLRTRRRRSSGPRETVSGGKMTIATTARRRKKTTRKASRRKTTGRKASTRKVSRKASRRKSSRKTSARKASRKSSKRSTAARKAARTRAAKKARRSTAAKKAARTRRARSSKRGGRRRTKRRASVRGSKRRSSRRRSSRRHFHGRKVRLTGREYIDKYLTRGVMPTVTRVGRLPLSRSGRQSIMTYAIPRTVGRLSRRKSVRGSSRRGYAVGATYRGRRKRRMTALAANRRRSRRSSRRNSRRRSSRRRSSRRGSRRRSTRNQMVKYATMTPNRRRRRSRRNSRRRVSRNIQYATANRRRRSRRNSRRRGSRRRVSRNQKYVVMNRRGSRRSSRRRGSRRAIRRNSRRRSSRRRMTRNMLAVSKLRYRGSGSSRVGTPKGRYYQLVEYGPKSGKKYRRAGYPVLVPPHVSQFSYVRKFRFGGAAKDAHARAKSGGYAERRRYSRWRKPPASWVRKSSKKKMTANRRRSSRRSSMRRNQKYVAMNRRRRVRRNSGLAAVLGGADLMRDVVTPVIGGTVGFVAARLLSNGLANVQQLRGMLDSGSVDAAGAANTKIAANLLGIAATLGLSTKVDIIKKNRGALVTGMGLALTDRLIQRFTGGSPYAGYLGEYVEGIGEYVDQPMSGLGTMYAAAGTGEYVDQPMSGLGTMYAAAGMGSYAEGVDPANMASIDGLMNVMEATAGGPMEAAAGFGSDEGSGEADAALSAMYAKRQPPWVSTQMPVSGALAVTGKFPLDREIQGSLVTPEGKGFAGGVFAHHLFAGMF